MDFSVYGHENDKNMSAKLFIFRTHERKFSLFYSVPPICYRVMKEKDTGGGNSTGIYYFCGAKNYVLAPATACIYLSIPTFNRKSQGSFHEFWKEYRSKLLA
jgi:hypothetical protein